MAEQVTRSIVVKGDAHRLFQLWSDLERFPQYMSHIRSVTRRIDGSTHWVMKGPLGTDLEWDAETTRLEPGRRIAWNSRGAGDVATSGQVTFSELGAGETEITVTLRYVGPAGPVGEAVASLLADPERMLAADLRRFKAFAELKLRAGEAPAATP